MRGSMTQALTARLRTMLLGELHVGRLRAGDRLPSIRQLAKEHGTDHRTVAQVCRILAAEGLVEVRRRSGVFVASSPGTRALGSAERWIGDVLFEAWNRRLPLPALAAFLDRVVGGTLRCAVLEETEDHLVACSAELDAGFGLRVVPFRLQQRRSTGRLAERDRIARLLRGVDMAVTTSFHAADLRPLAEETNTPLIVVSVGEQFGDTVRQQLREHGLTVVVADERYAARAMEYFAEAMAKGRLRVLLADDAAAVALRPARDVLFTRAARRRLGLPEQHLLGSATPYFSPAVAKALVDAMIGVATAPDASAETR